MNTTVLDIETLVREPDDPALQDCEPSHPWYYILGGRPLRVDEIKSDPSHNFLRFEQLPEDPEKRNIALLRLKAQTEKELAVDIARYEEIVAQGKAVLSQNDIMMNYGLETALFLKHNHIYYNKSLLAEIKLQLHNSRQKMLFLY